jgi:hypothetical protein
MLSIPAAPTKIITANRFNFTFLGGCGRVGCLEIIESAVRAPVILGAALDHLQVRCGAAVPCFSTAYVNWS